MNWTLIALGIFDIIMVLLTYWPRRLSCLAAKYQRGVEVGPLDPVI
jgi:hypothetical protein